MGRSFYKYSKFEAQNHVSQNHASEGGFRVYRGGVKSAIQAWESSCSTVRCNWRFGMMSGGVVDIDKVLNESLCVDIRGGHIVRNPKNRALDEGAHHPIYEPYDGALVFHNTPFKH